MEKLHEMDDAFRKQLESVLAAHEAELVQLANEKQKQIEAANEKVILILDKCLFYLYFILLCTLRIPRTVLSWGSVFKKSCTLRHCY